MAHQKPADPDGSRRARIRRSVRSLSILKLPVALLCLFGIGVAGYYFLYVTQQTRYVAGRNFRVLATIGDQVQGSVASARTVLQSFVKDRDVFKKGLFEKTGCTKAQDSFKTIADDYVPLFRTLRLDRGTCTTPGQTLNLSVQFAEAAGTRMWRSREPLPPKGEPVLGAILDLPDLVAPLLQGETLDDLFVSRALTTPGGRVIVQIGDPQLQVADFGPLPLRTEGAKTDQTFVTISGSPVVADLTLAGSEYALFIQPCCSGMAAVNAESSTRDGWVIVGLVPQSELRRAGLAFPTSVVLALSVALLLAVFAWPFLKLVLIGEHERVRAHDVLLVGVCSLLGLSFLTLGALDLYAYQKLLATLDGQLEDLATEIVAQTVEEAETVSEQLTALEQLALTHPKKDRVTGLADDTDFRNTPAFLKEYPYFESFAMIERGGLQVLKWTPSAFLTPLVRIPDREYVTHWSVDRPGERYFLEPIRSRTTGRAEVILSHRSRLPAGGDGVSALTVTLRSLLDPVIVPGFGFAVIDDTGRVLFQSDSEHNVSESFFAETDGSQRLRALVAARREELLNLRYWGNDHRAFVKPVSLQGMRWSLVTFYEKQLIRTVNMETLMSSVFYALVYGGLFVLGALVVLIVRPTYRAPWLWPDAAQASTYLRVVPVHLVLASAFVVALVTFSPDPLLWTSWLVPLVACCLTSVVLRPGGEQTTRLTWPAVVSVVLVGVLIWKARTSGSAVAFAILLIAGCGWAFRLGWTSPRRSIALAPPLNFSYGTAAAGFVALTAVLPAVGFFDVAYGIHTQNLIKYGQLTLAQSLADQEDRREDDARRRVKDGRETLDTRRKEWTEAHPVIGDYFSFFFKTSPADCPPAAVADQSQDKGVSVPAFLEELLPYYSESSVRLRELVHGGAADDSWSWSEHQHGLRLCVGPPGTVGRKAFQTSLLPLFGGGGPDDVWLTLLLVVGALLVATAATMVVRFIMRRILVVEVIEPLWSGRAAPAVAPPPTLLVLSQKEAADRFVQPARYHLVDLEKAGDGPEAWRQWLEEQADQIDGMPAEWNVLVLNFDHEPGDASFNEGKLSFVERLVTSSDRTVAIESAVPPERLFSNLPSRRGAAQRWAALQSACAIVPAEPRVRAVDPAIRPRLDWRPAKLSEFLWRLNALRFSRRAAFFEREIRDPFVESQWNEVLPFAWKTDERAPLDLEQVLIEVGDRARNYYQALWQSCTPAERVVLGQVATERLVNEKTSQTVRGLMARGLVERRPYFDVMNETFRRFVSTKTSDREVTRLQARHGTWDSFRWPFLLLLGATAAVFFGTQRELFQQTIGIATAVAATLPTLVKAVSMIGGKGGAGGDG